MDKKSHARNKAGSADQKEELIENASSAATQVIDAGRRARFEQEKKGYEKFLKFVDEEIKDLEEQITAECGPIKAVAKKK
jgi:hypothetical protein